MYCVQYITTTSTAQIFVCIDFHGFSENDTFIDCTLICSLPLYKYNVLLNIGLQWIDNMINQLYNKFQENWCSRNIVKIIFLILWWKFKLLIIWCYTIFFGYITHVTIQSGFHLLAEKSETLDFLKCLNHFFA